MSWSTAGLKLASNAQTRNDCLSDSSLKSSGGKPVCVVFEPDYLVNRECEANRWVVLRMNTITLVFLKTILNTLVPFFKVIPVILL